MPVHTINLKLDSNGNLSDPGTTEVKVQDNIVWQIGAGISSFRIEGKKSNHPFITPPDRNHNTMLKLQVHGKANPGDWEYTIIYTRNSEDREFQLDPKIAVKP